ncbi:MAG: glycosyltransferase family 4 protein, partial [Chitinophagaceae bacterium]|nr:glycosyltransferase family 4 protein [Chitinophagaceae bacterium]
MRIGLVLAATPPYSETFFRNKIRVLKEQGYEVILLVDKQKGAFDACPVKIGFSATAGPIAWLLVMWRLCANLRRALNLFRANKADGFSLKKNWTSLLTSAHILNEQLDWLHFGFASIGIGRENTAAAIGAKMAVSVRGSDLHVYPLEHPGCYTLLWKRIDRLHTISNYLLALAKNLGFNAEQKSVRLITPAIDTHFFQAQRTRLPQSTIKLITVARLHWIKGIEYIIEAIHSLKMQGIAVEYHLIGEGDDFKRLYFGVHQLGLQEQVIFHGKMSHEAINKALAEADVFI